LEDNKQQYVDPDSYSEIMKMEHEQMEDVLKHKLDSQVIGYINNNRKNKVEINELIRTKE